MKVDHQFWTFLQFLRFSAEKTIIAKKLLHFEVLFLFYCKEQKKTIKYRVHQNSKVDILFPKNIIYNCGFVVFCIVLP